MSREQTDQVLNLCLESLAEPGASRAELDRSADRMLRYLESEYTRVPERRALLWRPANRSHRLRWLTVAAMLLAAGLMLLRIDNGPIATFESGEVLRANQSFHVGNASAMLALEGESQVELSADSDFSAMHVFDGIELRLHRGNVLVTAAKRKRGHLYVRTPDCVVAVTGTVFSVRVEETGSRVSVYEGEVRVRQGSTSYTLARGQQLATSPVLGAPGIEAEIQWSRSASAVLARVQLPSAAQSVVPEGMEAIDGIVVDRETGAPLAGVSILIAAPNSPRVLFDLKSGSDGRFKTGKIPPGTYTIVASQAGFWDVSGTQVTIASGQSLQGVRMRLSRVAAMSGRVVDQNGQPVRSQLLELRTLSANTLRAADSGAMGGKTNDRGEYEFTDVLPGKYYIKTKLTPDVGVYYPGTLDVDDARPVELHPGAVLTGIDLTLPEVKLYSIRFKAPPESLQWFERQYGPWGPIEGLMADGRHSGRTSIYATPLFQQPLSTKTVPVVLPAFRLQREGKLTDARDNTSTNTGPSYLRSVGNDEYILKGIAPGKYRLHLTWSAENFFGQLNGPANRQWATINAAVEVVDKDVDLGVLAGQSGHLSIPVRFTYADGTPTEAALTASPMNWRGEMTLLNSRSPVLRLNGLDQGTYALQFMLAAKDRYISIARYGTQDLLSDPLMIDGADHGAIEILVDGPGGVVEGVVRDARGEAVANVTVVLAPPVYRRVNSSLFRTVRTDQNGSFQFVGIAPGEYSVYSWDFSVPLDYLDADWLRDYETRGTSVSVRKGQTINANVRLIPAR